MRDVSLKVRYPKPIKPEAALKRACLQYLKAKYGRRIWYFSVRGGIGQRPGIPDVMAILDGRGFGLEFKNGNKGRISDYQKEELAGITAAGGVALVIREIDDCIDYFKGLDGMQREIF